MLIALAVMAGLVALIAALSTNLSSGIKSQSDRMRSRRARMMAESGVQKAVQELQSLSQGKITTGDEWSTLGSRGTTDYSIGEDSFRLQIIDSGSKINLNTADSDTLNKLPMSASQVDCLMDWREKGANPRPLGAKDDYYNKLAKPYQTKLQSISSFDELLQVNGFTPTTLYDTSSQTPLFDLATVESSSADRDPSGNPKIDIRTATANQLSAIGVTQNLVNNIVQSQGSFQKMGDVVALQGMDQASAKAILNFCAIGGTHVAKGLVNVNTATQSVLADLPNLDQDLASSIAERQQDGFSGIGDLVDLPGLELSVLAKIVDLLCVSSRVFEVRVIGSAGKEYYNLTAELVIDNQGQVNVISEQPAPYPDSYSKWGWPQLATNHEVIGGIW